MLNGYRSCLIDYLCSPDGSDGIQPHNANHDTIWMTGRGVLVVDVDSIIQNTLFDPDIIIYRVNKGETEGDKEERLPGNTRKINNASSSLDCSGRDIQKTIKYANEITCKKDDDELNKRQCSIIEHMATKYANLVVDCIKSSVNNSTSFLHHINSVLIVRGSSFPLQLAPQHRNWMYIHQTLRNMHTNAYLQFSKEFHKSHDAMSTKFQSRQYLADGFGLLLGPKFNSLLHDNLKALLSRHNNLLPPCCIDFSLPEPAPHWFLLHGHWREILSTFCADYILWLGCDNDTVLSSMTACVTPNNYQRNCFLNQRLKFIHYSIMTSSAELHTNTITTKSQQDDENTTLSIQVHEQIYMDTILSALDNKFNIDDDYKAVIVFRTICTFLGIVGNAPPLSFLSPSRNNFDRLVSLVQQFAYLCNNYSNENKYCLWIHIIEKLAADEQSQLLNKSTGEEATSEPIQKFLHCFLSRVNPVYHKFYHTSNILYNINIEPHLLGQNDTTQWKAAYYKRLFNVEQCDVMALCETYIKCFQSYADASFTHVYTHSYSPCISDILLFIKQQNDHSSSLICPPYMSLIHYAALIKPPVLLFSDMLLLQHWDPYWPNVHDFLSKNDDAFCLHLYPSECKLASFLRNQPHMFIPVIPPIDLHSFLKASIIHMKEDDDS